MKRNILYALLILATGFGSCKKCEDHNPEGGNPGTGDPITENCNDVVCTAEFAQVMLEIRNTAGAPVVLDSFVVTNLSGIPLAPVHGVDLFGPPSPGNDQYVVINDGWLQGHQNTTMQIVAHGFKNGSQVVNEQFTISADCCHVHKVSGRSSITIP